jgi:hypothetical protein
MENQGQSFIEKLDNIAGDVLPYIEAAAAFKRGYQGGGPMRFGNDRMQEMLLKELEKSRERNETAVREAKKEEALRRSQSRTDKAVESLLKGGKISEEDYFRYMQEGLMPTFGSPELDVSDDYVSDPDSPNPQSFEVIPEVNLQNYIGEGGTPNMLGFPAIVRALKAGLSIPQIQDAATQNNYEFGQKAKDTFF